MIEIDRFMSNKLPTLISSFFFKQNNILFISRVYKYMYIKKMTIHNMIHSIINMLSEPKV